MSALPLCLFLGEWRSVHAIHMHACTHAHTQRRKKFEDDLCIIRSCLFYIYNTTFWFSNFLHLFWAKWNRKLNKKKPPLLIIFFGNKTFVKVTWPILPCQDLDMPSRRAPRCCQWNTVNMRNRMKQFTSVFVWLFWRESFSASCLENFPGQPDFSPLWKISS